MAQWDGQSLGDSHSHDTDEFQRHRWGPKRDTVEAVHEFKSQEPVSQSQGPGNFEVGAVFGEGSWRFGVAGSG